MYLSELKGKKIVVVLDNAPAHNQTEKRVDERDDLILLRLGPYSSMCTPIEGKCQISTIAPMSVRVHDLRLTCCICRSVLKARIQKAYLALHREDMLSVGSFPTFTARRMDLLERAARASMQHIDSTHLVSCMTAHCQLTVAAALRGEDME